MHTSPFDFVGALSAEELCPVCNELHAAVDECLCGLCQTHVCRDCSSLQPDTSWICTPCTALLPGRAYPIIVQHPRWAQAQRQAQIAVEHAQLWGRELGPLSARFLAQVGARAARVRLAIVTTFLAALVWSRALLSELVRVLVPLMRRLQARSRKDGARALAFVQRRQRTARAGLERGLRITIQTVRTFPVREHAISLVIATMILIAVARAENGPDAS